MTSWEHRYPHISLLVTLKPTPRILLGRRLFWTEKKDGHCMTMWFEEINTKKLNIADFTGKRGIDNWMVEDKVYHLNISSRNQKIASQDLQSLVRRTEEYPKVLKLLEENPQFVVYVEACRKGRSITGAELYERDCLFIFDIFDRVQEKFLPFVNTSQHGYHHEIQVVKIYAETRHRSMKDLLKYRNHVLY